MCDTSAPLQLILIAEMEPIRYLASDYKIEMVVVEAVEAELSRILQGRFSNKTKVFRKARTSRTLGVMNAEFLEKRGYLSAPLLNEISRLGREYAVRVDRGEAYTHAAANVLQVPTLSQDINALRKLSEAGVYVERPILRAFDVVAFGLQTERLTLDQCERARRELWKSGEALLSCFANCSVRDGLPLFFPRLLDRELPEIGAARPVVPFDERLWISRATE